MKRTFKQMLLSPQMGSPRTAYTTTGRIPSLVTPGGSAALKEPLKYTGTSMLGIATMHKSNAVPVFSNESAKDISQMRR